MTAELTGPRTVARTSAGRHARVDVLGIHVSVTDMDDTVETFDRWIAGGDRQLVCVSDMNALLQARADERLTELYNTSGMTLPDGMPLVWAGRKAGFDRMARVCGPDLLERVMAEAAERGWSQYFYGGADGVAEQLRETFVARHPELEVAGVHCPPYRELSAQEDAEIVDRINEAKPDIVWVGLGAPKQERWMAEHRERLDAAILIGVGAAFDFHTGRVDRAPLWMQRSGLEWSYRLAKEPRRLWRRYVLGIPRFGAGILRRPPRPVS
ncbi:N-acetylglucosaminyldiphosphoundecaprenol N-acetyl-beta-D-mannosaminyltransferase [Kribbella sp. VKM Ac-2527]|uniref:N-acetylglucosaminyldiphosphoundecaprenol N-acetyl-beta-D-mannosaminyltransferase n=1 Tax=Kribbella caucasensis TaxID=2512215 RepID=A0A4V3C914_9ACTN|nr:WecB/TagA/CpsF family glycosyltransferase [Kribbella sp. VKM Ac-2527]TDO43338.1 N-acetylglucosaminyldiphosphoundecaprenol N-acetyl-beta-D-mannosaminyltransferase [Kribbella sp. VKM Ac-2527]